MASESFCYLLVAKSSLHKTFGTYYFSQNYRNQLVKMRIFQNCKKQLVKFWRLRNKEKIIEKWGTKTMQNWEKYKKRVGMKTGF